MRRGSNEAVEGWLAPHFFQNHAQVPTNLREFVLDGAPDELPVNVAVVVNEVIAHACHRGPWDLRVRVAERLGQSLRGVADDLQRPDDGKDRFVVVHEGLVGRAFHERLCLPDLTIG